MRQASGEICERRFRVYIGTTRLYMTPKTEDAMQLGSPFSRGVDMVPVATLKLAIQSNTSDSK